jgi:hypothetical protein
MNLESARNKYQNDLKRKAKAANAKLPLKGFLSRDKVKPKDLAWHDAIAENKRRDEAEIWNKAVDKNSQELEKPDFIGREEINGIDMSVAMDDRTGQYSLFFESHEGEISAALGLDWNKNEDLIRLSDNPHQAKELFKYACEVARGNSDAAEVWKTVKERAASLIKKE